MKKIILVLLFLIGCETTQLTDPEKLNLTGTWQATKDAIVDGVNYEFHASELQLVDDAGKLTLTGTFQINNEMPLDITGTGAFIEKESVVAFSFTTSKVYLNGQLVPLVGQFQGNLVYDAEGLMLRGHLRLIEAGILCVMHYRATPGRQWFPNIKDHDQGGIF
jgi:hypothetical protein